MCFSKYSSVVRAGGALSRSCACPAALPAVHEALPSADGSFGKVSAVSAVYQDTCVSRLELAYLADGRPQLSCSCSQERSPVLTVNMQEAWGSLSNWTQRRGAVVMSSESVGDCWIPRPPLWNHSMLAFFQHSAAAAYSSTEVHDDGHQSSPRTAKQAYTSQEAVKALAADKSTSLRTLKRTTYTGLQTLDTQERTGSDPDTRALHSADAST